MNIGTDTEPVLEFNIPMGEPGKEASAVSAYGGLYQDAQQQLTLTAADTYEPISMNTAMPAQGIAASANGTLSIQEPGDYEVSYNVSVQANAPSTLRVAVRNNGTVLPETQDTQRLLQGSDTSLYIGRFASQALVRLAAGDTLDLAIAAADQVSGDINVTTGGYANTALVVKRLSK